MTIIHLIQADVTKLPIRDNAFDLAVSAGALSEIANPQLAIEEIIRTTKPNGKITLLVYAKKREAIFDPWAFTEYKLYRMLKEAHSHLEKLLYLDPYYILFIFSKKT
ncbi:MAG: hypothetical protein DRJ35_07325 [Thermoprotei archaeon]|nr:MAG: hypothetical protein DRJ35_07325 [Thermoprotei archaeon]